MEFIRDDEVIVKDINLASLLLLKNFELNRKCNIIKTSESETLNFYFKKTPDLERAISLFNNPSDESNNFYQLCGELFNIRKELIENVDKCEKILKLVKGDKVLMISENLPKETREKLLKRF